jgi:hypothetical protein
LNWKVNKDKTKDHWLEVEDPEGWWSAVVKWDGCIHLNRYYNIPKNEPERIDSDVDYLHICDLDEFIKDMQDLREKAKEHFGEDWN